MSFAVLHLPPYLRSCTALFICARMPEFGEKLLPVLAI